MSNNLRHRMVSLDQVNLHLVEAGPSRGQPVMLLHGFPEFWFGWRYQISALAQAGFRVLAPDARGYNRSSQPPQVADYRLKHLRSDVIGLLDALEISQVMLVGHDWGAALAWSVALHRPDRVSRLAILNMPHPAVMNRMVRTNPRQMLRSWYILFFQLPWLPELAMGSFDGKLLAQAMVRTSKAGTFKPEDLLRYRGAWRQGRLKTMVHWYRAAVRHRQMPPASWQLAMPVRILWGTADAFLLAENAAASLAYCPQGELIELPDVSHWLQHEQADRVNELLLDWCRQG